MKKYKSFVRSFGCILYDEYGYECLGSKDVHHVTTRGAGGKDERNLVCLCRAHHVRIHSMGKKTFQKHYEVNLEEIKHDLWEMWKEETGEK